MAYFRQAFFIFIISVAVGIGYNAVYPKGISIFSYNPIPDVKKEAVQDSLPTIDLETARKLFDAGDAIFVDARPAAQFSQGRIPGAVNIPENDFDAYFPRFQMIATTSDTIIVYCDGRECLASLKVANMLKKKGYSRVKVFFGGWQQWLGAAYPIEWD